MRTRVKTPQSPKHKIVYAETYASHGLRIKAHCLPTLPSATLGYVVHSAYVMKAGCANVDGEELEFQDVRIYLTERRDEPEAVGAVDPSVSNPGTPSTRA